MGSPDPSVIHSQSAHSPGIITSTTGGADEIIRHKAIPNSFPVTRRFNHHSRNRCTKRTDNETIGVSLHERFADVMNLVRRLPSGEQPKNALFTPFFTRNGQIYVCLLCHKRIANRTQMIQHITGQHGESRPFACLLWSVAYISGSTFIWSRISPHRAVRKRDLETHTAEVHGSLRHYCPKW
jgi:hypothetical protein